MSDDIGQLLSPGLVARIGQDAPRRDQQPPPRRRRPPDAPRPADRPDAAPPDDEPRLVGSRLNVRV